ncbi:MAG: hypothetical protein M3270_11360 [Thermoproteota archaeon]|nr:hypothetical protein [Thermoproteota archaeon]
MKQSVRATEAEEKVKSLPVPSMENADKKKKSPAEILAELSDRGYGFIPFGDAAEFYTEGLPTKKEKGSNEIVKIPSNTKLAAKMNQGKKKESPIY